MYGPLSRARGKVERGLTGDNEISPDLADLLTTPCASTASFCEGRVEELGRGNRSGPLCGSSWVERLFSAAQTYEVDTITRCAASRAQL